MAIAGRRRPACIDDAPAAELDALLSTKSVARLVDAPLRTVHRWIASGRLPPPDLRIGVALRWRMSTIRDWLERIGTK